MKEEDFLRQYPYGVLIIHDDLIVHSVGYPNEPTEEDLKDLQIELAEDTSLGFTDLEDYLLVAVDPLKWRTFLESMLRGLDDE